MVLTQNKHKMKSKEEILKNVMDETRTVMSKMSVEVALQAMEQYAQQFKSRLEQEQQEQDKTDKELLKDFARFFLETGDITITDEHIAEFLSGK